MHPGAFPLAKLAVVFILAAATGIHYRDFYHEVLMLLFAVSIVLIFIPKTYRFNTWRQGLWFALSFSGMFLFTVHSWRGLSPARTAQAENGVYKIKVSEIKRNDSLQLRIWGETHDEWGVELFIKSPESVENLLPNDIILVREKLKTIAPALNPGQFDYKRYLAQKHIYYQVFLNANDHYLIKATDQFSLNRLGYRIQKFLRSSYEKMGITNEELAVSAALIFGDKGLLDEELRQSFVAAGAMHVLAVSGLHVGIIYLILLVLFRVHKRQQIPVRISLLIIAVLWLYALITGLSPSVQRAATLFSFLALSKGISRQSHIFNLLGASVVLLILVNPLIILEVGFQLSYVAVLGIICFYPWIYSLWQPNHKLLNWIWQLSAVSICAQLTTGVLSIYYFHQFPSYFLISNIIVIPLATVLVWLGAIINITLIFSIEIAGYLAQLLQYLVEVLNASVRLVDVMPYSVFTDLHLSNAHLILYFLVLLSGLGFLHHRSKFWRTSLQLVVLGLMLIPTEKREPERFIAFAHSWGDFFLFREQGTFLAKDLPDKTINRILRDYGLKEELEPSAIPYPTFNKDVKSPLWIKNLGSSYLINASSQSLAKLSHFPCSFILFIDDPIWDVGCINEVKPHTILLSNKLHLGYMRWLLKNGLDANIAVQLPKVHGPLIQL